jgi:hypothetical protein
MYQAAQEKNSCSDEKSRKLQTLEAVFKEKMQLNTQKMM